MLKKLPASLLIFGLVSASLPPGCFAIQHEEGSRFVLTPQSGPVAVASIRDLASILAVHSSHMDPTDLPLGQDHSLSDTPENAIESRGISVSEGDLLNALDLIRNNGGAMLIPQPGKSSLAVQALTPGLAVGRLNQAVQSAEDKARIDALAAALSQAQSREATLQILREFYEASPDVEPAGVAEETRQTEAVLAEQDGTSQPAASAGRLSLRPSGVQEALASENPNTPKLAAPEQKKSWNPFKGISELPKSYVYGYIGGWTLKATGEEFFASSMGVIAAAALGAPHYGFIVWGVEMLSRIAGLHVGASITSRINPLAVTKAAILSYVIGGVLVTATLFLHASFAWILPVFFLNVVMRGFGYGITRGITETTLPPLIIGRHNEALLERGNNLPYVTVELGCVLATLIFVPLIFRWPGVASLIITAIGTGLLFLSRIPYSWIHFVEEWKPEPQIRGAERIKIAAIIQAAYVYIRFNHFMVYGILSTLWSLYRFHSKSFSSFSIGWYDVGSGIAGFFGALVFLQKIKPFQLLTLLAGTSIATLWSTELFHSATLTLFLLGALGGLVTLCTSKIGAYLQKNVPGADLAHIMKWLLTYSMGALAPFYLAVAINKLLPNGGAGWLAWTSILSSIDWIIFCSNIIVSAAGVLLVVMAYFLRLNEAMSRPPRIVKRDRKS